MFTLKDEYCGPQPNKIWAVYKTHEEVSFYPSHHVLCGGKQTVQVEGKLVGYPLQFLTKSFM